MNTSKKIFFGTDEYISEFPPDVQKILNQIRAAIKKAAPKATEVISYGMPAFKQNKVLVYFAAGKNHIGFYPTPNPIVFFSKELAAYKTSKGAIQFPYTEPLPLKLISKIVKYRVAEDLEISSKKKSK
jgi:uncharacterized protein YdhG (YjbR/CyaY superfamily)